MNFNCMIGLIKYNLLLISGDEGRIETAVIFDTRWRRKSVLSNVTLVSYDSCQMSHDYFTLFINCHMTCNIPIKC